jgi:hypothetical protein
MATVYASPGSASKNSDTFRYLGPQRPEPVAHRVGTDAADALALLKTYATRLADGEFVLFGDNALNWKGARITRPATADIMPVDLDGAQDQGWPQTGFYQVTWRPGESDVLTSGKVPTLSDEGYEFLYRIIDYSNLAKYVPGTACIIDAIDLDAIDADITSNAPDMTTRGTKVGLRLASGYVDDSFTAGTEAVQGYEYGAVVVSGPDANGWVKFRRSSGFRHGVAAK